MSVLNHATGLEGKPEGSPNRKQTNYVFVCCLIEVSVLHAFQPRHGSYVRAHRHDGVFVTIDTIPALVPPINDSAS